MSADVAVVIPCHNAEAWLRDTLLSVRAQTTPVAEVIVVDDGSTDGSAAIADELGVRCERQACGGPASARNAGVRATSATWIAFLDADDQFAPDKLEKQLADLERTDAVMSCTDGWRVCEGVRERRKNAGRTVPGELDLTHLVVDNPVICSSVVVRRSAVEAAGWFDEDPVLVATEDYDLWLRIAPQGAILYRDEPLVEYRVTPGQLSDDRRFSRGIDRISEKLLAAHPDDAALARRVRSRRAGVRLDAAYHEARSGRSADARRWLREARELGAPISATWRTWLRTWVR